MARGPTRNGSGGGGGGELAGWWAEWVRVLVGLHIGRGQDEGFGLGAGSPDVEDSVGEIWTLGIGKVWRRG